MRRSLIRFKNEGGAVPRCRPPGGRPPRAGGGGVGGPQGGAAGLRGPAARLLGHHAPLPGTALTVGRGVGGAVSKYKESDKHMMGFV